MTIICLQTRLCLIVTKVACVVPQLYHEALGEIEARLGVFLTKSISGTKIADFSCPANIVVDILRSQSPGKDGAWYSNTNGMAREASDDHRTSSRRHSSGYGDRSHRHRSSRQTDRNSYRTDTGLSPEKLTSLNEQLGWSAPRAVRRDEKRHRVERPRHADRVVREHRRQRNVSDDFYYRNEQGRVASGAPLVETYDDSEKRRSRRHYDRKAEEREHRKRRRRRWLISEYMIA